MNRWPALILVFGLLAGLVVLDRRAAPKVDEVEPSQQELAMGPASAAPGASGSTWYCPAGFATPDASSDHTVIITNPTDEVIEGTLTIYPTLIDTLNNSVPFPRALQVVEVAPQSQQEISLAPLVVSLDEQLARNDGAFVGALAEFDGAGVNVHHRVSGPQGADFGPCATSAGTRWWFASGTTTTDVDYQLYLLNPFPDDAVVDISFVTDTGTRSNAFNAKLIPAQSLTILQIAPEVPINEQMTAQVTVLTGRVIAERIQLFGNEAGPAGLSMSLGTNRLAEQWFFPAGRSFGDAAESYVIYNPGDTAAEVEFELKPDTADRVGDVAPRVVPVGPRERWIVTVTSQPTHPVDDRVNVDATGMAEPNETFFVSIRSFNGVPIVAERVLTRSLSSGGVAASLGVDVAATEQFLYLPPSIELADESTLAVVNPAGDTISRVKIIVGNAAGEETRVEVELPARRRGAFDLRQIVEEGDLWIRVESSTATMAELTLAFGNTIMTSRSVPVQDTTSIPDLFAFDTVE